MPKAKPSVSQATILAHEWLVLKAASQYRHAGGGEMEDLVQQGWLGLLRAARKWNHHKGVTFGAYARLWVKGSIYRYCFGLRPRWENAAEPLIVDAASYQAALDLDLLEDALATLPGDHYQVLRERLVNRQSLTKTARATGHTAADALALYEQGLDMLRVYCA